MILGTNSSRNDRGSAGAQTDRDARDDHEHWKTEAEGGERAITDLTEEPCIDQALPHHRRDTEQHWHGHVDEVSADRPLCEFCFGWFLQG